MQAYSKLGLQVLVDCVAVTLVVAFAVGLLPGTTPLDELGPTVVEIWLYVILIAAPAHWVLPRLRLRFVERRPAARWAVFVVVLTAISVHGSVVGGVIVFFAGLEPGVPLRAVLVLSVKLSVFLALVVGVVHAMFVLLQDRLHEAETKLHQQQLQYAQALKLASEARLAALEARIHPHFLFNALNTISSLIPTAPARAEELLQRLSALLRYSLDAHQDGLVPLRREIKITRDYLEIEQARFGPRLRFSIEIKDDVADKHVPPFSVQTLVENSVKHAMGVVRAGVEIRVRAAAEANGVHVEVADTGPGFSAGEFPAGHGLDTLRGRLTALFGDENPLCIASRDRWTIVAFRAPG